VTKVTSHPPPGAAAYFILLLCVIITLQTLKFHSPVSLDPLNARSLRSLGFPKSPPLKNPRSANELIVGHTTIKYDDPRLKMSHSACDIVRHFQPRVRHSYLLLPYFTVNKDCHNRCVGGKAPRRVQGQSNPV